MRHLVLIKHARPHVNPAITSEEWQLGKEGTDGAARLVDPLRRFSFDRIYSSDEPKAAQTAQTLGQALERPVEQVPDLREHDRQNVPHMDSREFISLVALFFREPDRLVLGNETADEAYARFAAAIDAIIARETRDVALVTHGTVISLFVQRRADREPFALWRAMGLPSVIILEIPSWKIVDLIERV
jgi:2,3-bisphosphoglycerate-dependent phosphoglycerate mutase